MLFYPYTLQRHNPLRPVNWRARRLAQILAGDGNFNRRRDDMPTVEAACHARFWPLCTCADEVRMVDRRWPGFFGARFLRKGDPWRRLELEARLLAGQSDEDIARLVATTAAAVQRYAQLFFDVRGRLRARDYIIHRAIRRGLGPDVPAGLASFVRGVAYFGGPLVLDATLVALGPSGSLVQVRADLGTSEGRQADRIRTAAQAHLLGKSKAGLKLLRALPELLPAELTVSRVSQPDFSQLAAESMRGRKVKVSDPPQANLQRPRTPVKDSQAA